MSNTLHKFPNFIGIGAARSGSTWLFKNLEEHSNVWIPHIKELHYFSRSTKYHGPSHLNDRDWLKRAFSSTTPYRKYRSLLYRAVGSNIVKPSLMKLRWDIKYFFGMPSDDWYKSLYDEGNGKITGEITPQYSVLDIDEIHALKKLNPNVKIIFFLRDPVERAWSLVRYHEKRFGQPLTSLPTDEIIRLAQHPAIVAQSDYKSILKNWRSVFDEEHFFTAFFDEIHENPAELLERVFKFLGLNYSSRETKSSNMEKVVNASFDKSMPVEVRKFLINYYYEQIKLLSEEENKYFSKWLQTYDSWLLRNSSEKL